jgi:hypothetical protein
VSCFKPFKTTFKKERNNNKVRNNYNELNKAIFATWVDKALDVTLFKKTSRMGLRLHEFGLLIQRLWMEGLSLVNSMLLIATTH